jgi:hypothetical protein
VLAHKWSALVGMKVQTIQLQIPESAQHSVGTGSQAVESKRAMRKELQEWPARSVVRAGTHLAECLVGHSESLVYKAEKDRYVGRASAEIGMRYRRRLACTEVGYQELDGERRDFVPVASFQE